MGFFEVFAGVLAGFYALIPSYGLAIILLTLASRVILLPLSIKSTRSMREMQVIQPEIKKLQKKYKGDRQKLNTEMMALYKEHGVNPFGGCLPLLLQMPVFIALFQVIQKPLEYMGYQLPDAVETAPLSEYVPEEATGFIQSLQGSSLADDFRARAVDVMDFFGLQLDCSPSAVYGGNPSPIGDCGSGGLLAALPYFALILLMGASTYFQQRQMLAKRGPATDPQQQQMQTFMKVMPAILLIFGFTFPTGVVLYWVTTNLWTIVQQRIMLKAAPPVEGGKESAGKGSEAKGAKAKATKGGDKAKATKGGDKAKATKGGTKTTAKTSKSDGKAKGQLTGGPDRAPKKNPAKKSPSGSSKGSSKKKKR